MAEDVATWRRRDPHWANVSDKAVLQRMRQRLERYLATIAAARASLEGVDAAKPLFVIEPGNWQIDFDGDGDVSVTEQFFFWVPRRGSDVPPLVATTDPVRLRSSYVSPVIHVDQSDVYWAIAYCHFAEAALNLLLAYDVVKDGPVLVDAGRIRNVAYKRLLDGVRYSSKLRASLLRETDDDREWIASPRQKHTSFPLVMDAQTFETWGTMLPELERVLQGRALLGGSVPTRGPGGVRTLTWDLCGEGQGLNVRELFMNPLQRPFDGAELKKRCVRPTAATPMSGLAGIASASIARNAGKTPEAIAGEWMVLRHLYWVN
ncbi:MAG TPA: hypothetical protein VF059_12805 [Casimicrobiaceae bacterium]